jgi:hypothetical protein
MFQLVEKVKYATPVLFAGGEKLFVGGVRERATEKKKVIFQRVAEFISATCLSLYSAGWIISVILRRPLPLSDKSGSFQGR